MKYKHCLKIYVADSIEYKKLLDDFIIKNSSKYIFSKKYNDADIVIITGNKIKDKINILISSSNEPIECCDMFYPFQPFLYDKNGDMNLLSDLLGDFTEIIANDFELPYRVDNTIRIIY